MKTMRGHSHMSRRFVRSVVKTVVVASFLFIYIALFHSSSSPSSWFGSAEKIGVEPSGNDAASLSLLESDECRKVRNKPESEQCAWVKHHCSDTEGLLFSYLEFRYCLLKGMAWLAYILALIWMLMLFFLLGDTAEVFFCESLERISEALKLSQNVAGVTFLALGNGAPDIFSIVAGVSSGSSGIGLGIPIGAGVFVTTVVMGTVTIFTNVVVTRRPFIRDILFYIFSILYVVYTTLDNVITIGEAIVYIVIYIIYVMVVVFGRMIFQAHKRRKRQQQEHIGLTVTRSAEDTGDVRKRLLEDDEVMEESGASYLSPVDASGPGGRQSQTRSRSSSAVDHLVLPSSRSHSINAPPILSDSSSDNDDVGIGMAYAEGLRRTVFDRFLDHVGWSEKNKLDKFLFILFLPFHILRRLTIPRLDEWNRYLSAAPIAFAPVFLLFAAGEFLVEIDHKYPIAAIIFVVMVPFAILTFKLIGDEEPKKGMMFFVLMSFVMSVAWIYVFANELVVLLQSVGIMLNVDDALLGLTVLSWGNSVGGMLVHFL
eukprot:TRINITY_DN1631_c0_g1_i1.p1 TRINITY_DN1631_c0_g1~~TRINITY_DN1631_c0_g1_i1.p1  ORF type:complete len:541 (+),score=113.06 TRINITY_DN1631_c0_g1_i1:139-1761(+)